jgi:hypothetical protein
MFSIINLDKLHKFIAYVSNFEKKKSFNVLCLCRTLLSPDVILPMKSSKGDYRPAAHFNMKLVLLQTNT